MRMGLGTVQLRNPAQKRLRSLDMALWYAMVPCNQDDGVQILGRALKARSSQRDLALGLRNNFGRALFWCRETVLPRTCRILDGPGGHLEPGQLMAIMGPSGSGKSTLLKSIAGIGELPLMSGLDHKSDLNKGLLSCVYVCVCVCVDDLLHASVSSLAWFCRIPARLQCAGQWWRMDSDDA